MTTYEKIKELCVPFMDGEISESEKVFFIKHVQYNTTNSREKTVQKRAVN